MTDLDKIMKKFEKVDVNFEANFAELKTIAENEQSDEQIAAQYATGWLYYKDHQAPIIYEAAIIWFKKAAKKGHPHAQFYLGEIYEIGENGITQDLLSAFMYYSLAVENNCIFGRMDNSKKVVSDNIVAVYTLNRVREELAKIDQILEAEEKLATWKEENPNGCPDLNNN